MGLVLCAHHLHLDERVAIKFLLPELARDGGLVARFLREGRASIKIRSEHVVRVLDVETLPGGTPYMAMEYLDGCDLSQLLERERRLSIATACDYLLQAVEAIAEAHALGMVHRDLKPSNLFLARRADGTPCVKVLDFGITKQVRGDAAMTSTNAVMGSPRYMSPEQMRSSKAVDPRSDIWALGVILQELLTGAPPFEGDTMPELLVKVLEQQPVPLANLLPDAPVGLQKVVEVCLEKDPNSRFLDVAEFARALAPFGSPLARASAERIGRVLGSTGEKSMSATALEPIAASKTSGNWSNTAKPSNARRRGAFAFVAGTLVLAVVVVGLVARGRSHTPSVAPASLSADAPAEVRDEPARTVDLTVRAEPPMPPPPATETPSATPVAEPPPSSAAAPRTHEHDHAPPVHHAHAPGAPAAASAPGASSPPPQGNSLFDGRR